MLKLSGHGVALITPFDKNGDIDFEAFYLHIERLISSKVDYLVVMGTTAETATLTPIEKNRLQSFVVDTVNRRLPLVLGVGGNDTQTVTAVLQQTNLEGYAAILSVCPYYNKPNQEGLFQHFDQIAKHSDLPIILYNVPGRTSCNLLPDTVVRLAEKHSKIIGIKEASGDMLQVQNLIRKTPDTFQVISGDDALAVPIILAGGVGVISVFGNLMPDRMTQMIHLALENRVKEANNEQYALMDLMELLFMEGNPTGLKAALYLQGYCENTLRLPLVSASENLLEALRNEMGVLELIKER